MTIEDDYQAELRLIAKGQVTMTEPELASTSENNILIAEKNAEINGLKSETIERPSPKSAYLARITELEGEISVLREANQQINISNGALIEAAETQYEEDITMCMATEKNKWSAVRVIRNELLRECDWTHVSDSPLGAEDKNLCKDYRKALRDIPDDYEDPETIVWPTKPARLGTEV
jgi:hypothetical protein